MAPGLASQTVTSRRWSVQPCIRPVSGAVRMTAGHNGSVRHWHGCKHLHNRLLRTVKALADCKHGVSRSWVYRFTSPVTKRVRWMGLGSCDVVPLAEARDLAKHACKLVTFGADPIEHRKATVAAEREAYLHEQASKMTLSFPTSWRDCASATACRPERWSF